MKTDVIIIRADGTGIDRALCETEKAAVYCGLEPKQALRLRLLAEEMTGMLRTIVGESDHRYWLETSGKAFSLHLLTDVMVDRDQYEELVKSSTSGRNDAAAGFMGRVRDILLKMRDPVGTDLPVGYGYTYVDPCGCDPMMMYPSDAMFAGWSLNAYREEIQAHREDRPEQWDELERSITANLADDVKVFIHGKSVELVVLKTFD